MTSPEIVRFTDKGLGNDAYLLVAGADALVIDAERDVRPYVAAAEERGARIVAALDTHLHADFVTGARELAARGAEVFASAAGDYAFAHRGLAHGDRAEAGPFALRSIATPGHTPEHLAFLLEGADPPVLFSGGALMPGGAARTDLLGPDRTLELARALYRTLTQAFADLPNATIVHPTHGAGSFCSAGGGHGDRSTTLGAERTQNPLLAARDEDDFVERLLSGYGHYPPYFLRLREVNRAGPPLLGDGPTPAALSAEQVRKELAAGAWPIDTRPAARWTEAHLKDSVAIQVASASFATWVGWVVPWATRLVLIAEDEAAAREAGRRAAGIGYEDVAGWARLDDLADAGFEIATTPSHNADATARLLDAERPPTLIDVRRPSEHAGGMIPGALGIEAGTFGDGVPQGLTGTPVLIYCASGNRANIAASLLERAGAKDVAVFPGGFPEWRRAGHPIERP